MVDLKKLKPIGVVMILLFSVLAFIMCFVADMGIPKPYAPAHDVGYYTQSLDTMGELMQELEENEFSRLSGIKSYRINDEATAVEIFIDTKNYGKVTAVLSRDFGESLFEYNYWTEG